MKRNCILSFYILVCMSVMAVTVDNLEYYLVDPVAYVVHGDNYYNLEKAVIPATITIEGKVYSVTEIEYEAFLGCNNLKELTIGDSVKIINERAFHDSPIKKLTWNAKHAMFPWYQSVNHGVQELDEFNKPIFVDSLEELVIGDYVEVIPQEFVCGSLICNLTIPKSIMEIGRWALSGCSKLQSLHVQAENPKQIKLGGDVFTGTADHCTLYVPKGSAGLYRQADQWKEFKNIVEEGEEVDNPYDLNHDGQVDVTDVDLIIDAVLGRR